VLHINGIAVVAQGKRFTGARSDQEAMGKPIRVVRTGASVCPVAAPARIWGQFLGRSSSNAPTECASLNAKLIRG
jgi:hypothetical protein